MKVLRVTMPDGSRWDVPVSVVQENWWAYYKDKDFHEDEFDDAECIDWAQNNMNWSDVEGHADMSEIPAVVDYQDGWINGDREIVDI